MYLTEQQIIIVGSAERRYTSLAALHLEDRGSELITDYRIAATCVWDNLYADATCAAEAGNFQIFPFISPQLGLLDIGDPIIGAANAAYVVAKIPIPKVHSDVLAEGLVCLLQLGPIKSRIHSVDHGYVQDVLISLR